MTSGGDPRDGGPDGAGLGADVTLAELEADPHPVLARLRATEPVCRVPALAAWLVTRRDLALEVMRAAETFTVDDPRFSTARVVGPSMLSLDGDAHARHRAPFSGPFRLAAVRERFTEAVRDEAERLVDGLAGAGEGELRRGFAGPLAAAAMARALGLERAGVPAVLRWYDAIVAAVTGVTAGEPVSAAGRDAVAQLRAAVEQALDGDSLLAAAAGGLERDAVFSNAAVLLFGGIETTEGMIVNALWHLLTHPAELARVRADPALLPGAVEESLRLEPAAATVDRYARRDVALAGAEIRKGDLVTVSVAAANRDPAAFGDPDRFDVTRADARRHLAFAAGPHVCLGMHLARLEAHTALEIVLDRLPGLELAAATAPRGLVFRKPPELRVRWEG